MDRYIDKTTVFVLCSVFYIQYRTDIYVIVPIIAIVIIGTLMSYMDNEKASAAITLGYLILCVYHPVFLFFLPVVDYDMFCSRYVYGLALALVPLGISFSELRAESVIFILLCCGFSYLLKHRTAELTKLRNEYIALRDDTKEFSLRLESKNKELMEKQDYEVNLATLNERNRIARDIHDSVGHLLSNSILQTGALLATCRDEDMKSHLTILKETLVTGMEAIRSSVHDLYDDSIDLSTEITRLCGNFSFCEITFDCDLEKNPDKNIRYALLSVVKESLSNVIRHSDATHVTVSLKEHPALYRLIVRDNGSKKEVSGEGIGLKNITQRVVSAGGHVNIGYDRGFTVFASIPKDNNSAAIR